MFERAGPGARRPARVLASLAIACALVLAGIPGTGIPGAGPAFGQATRIAAVVNDDIVTLHDVEARTRLVLAASNLRVSPEAVARVRPQVIRTLIDEKLQLQEGARARITATDEEIQQGIQRIERQNNMPPGGFFSWLDQNGIDRATATEQIKVNIVWSKVMRRKYGRTVRVSDEEIDEVLAQREASKNTVESRVAEIFLAFNQPGQEDQVRATAERLIDQMRSGARFSEIARQYSESATAAVGGDVGWVSPGQLEPVLDEAVAKLQPGQLAGPIRTPSGIYVLLLIDRRRPGETPADRAQQAAQLRAQQVAERRQARLPPATSVVLRQIVIQVRPSDSAAEKERKAKLATELSRTLDGCQDMAERGRKIPGSLSGNLGRVKISDLPEQLRAPISTQPIGKPTPPLQSQAGLIVLMVCERTAPAQAPEPPPAPAPAPVAEASEAAPSAAASAEEAREEVAEFLTRQRLNLIALRVIRDLRRTAFIDIRI